MVRVLLDTNIILDLLSFDRAGHDQARRLLEALLDNLDCEVVVSASSLNDAYYILCRHYSNEEWARDDIRTIRSLFTVAELTLDVIDRAMQSDEPDFEDALVRVCAEKYGAKYIVSRDRKAFVRSKIPRIDPGDDLSLPKELFYD